MESCLAVALVGLAVFTAASTFGGSLSDKIVHGIVPGLGGPQSLQVAGAGSVGGGDGGVDDSGSVGGSGGGDAATGDTGSVGGGDAGPPDWEPDTGSVGGGGGGDSYGDTGSVGGGAAEGGDPGSEE